ncbi:MAG: TRAP transporter large permease [Lachnospiraceae bacterium]|nr:TRAP transporter large permease [Lachnospiraceae bacterium]
MLGIVAALFVVMLFLGVPIAAAMMFATLWPTLTDPTFAGNVNYLIRAIESGWDSTPTLAIPLFMLSGAIMANGGISKKLFDVFAYFIGKVRAGMPCAVVITCLFYGAISGSGPATVAAVGAMCIPILVDLGYDKVFAAAIVATAGGLGVIIPPSIPFIMYGVTTGTSVGDMFTAGIIPGFLIAALLMLYCVIYCTQHGEDREKIDASVAELRKKGLFGVFREGFWAILTPVIILGGIYSGIVTPTEAACVSVFYAIIVSCFIYRTMKVREVWTFMKSAVRSYAPICLLLAFAIALGRVLTLLQAPTLIANIVTSTFSNKYTFLLVLNLILLLIGMFMDTASAISILGPVLLVTANGFGIDSVQFGVILVVNLAIGLVSPPVGINLFVASPLVGESSWTVGKKAIVPICFFLVALLLINVVPAISLILL